MVAAANPLAVDAGYRILRQGGTRGRRGDRRAAGARSRRAAVVRDSAAARSRSYHAAQHAAPRRVRRPRNGAGRGDARTLPRRRRHAARFREAVDRRARRSACRASVRLLEIAPSQARHACRGATLFAPAIALAEHGFAVSPRLHALIAAETQLPARARARISSAPDGSPRAVGTLLRNPAYAATLRRLAQGGADAFYAGAIAQDIVDTRPRASDESRRSHARRSRGVSRRWCASRCATRIARIACAACRCRRRAASPCCRS